LGNNDELSKKLNKIIKKAKACGQSIVVQNKNIVKITGKFQFFQKFSSFFLKNVFDARKTGSLFCRSNLF